MANLFVSLAKAIVGFLYLAECCFGMQPGLEYVYHYEGLLASSITNIHSQYAVVAIRSDVTVQVEEDYSLLVQFDKVETGDLHDVLMCDHPFPIQSPIRYQPIEEGADYIHKPFKVATEGAKIAESLHVPADEPVWVTNVKKAFVDIFPIRTLRKEAISSKGFEFMRPFFEACDELVTGNCVNRYSVAKVPDIEAARENANRTTAMEEDVQREESSAGAKGSTSSAPAQSPFRPSFGVHSITDSLWKVVRTTDFDKCRGMPTIFKTNPPKDIDKIISRSSVAQYLIRGSNAGMRIEEVTVEGGITVSTSNRSEDLINTFTEQRLLLKAARTHTKDLTTDFETKKVSRCFYETDDHKKRDGTISSLEERLTGRHLTEDDISEIKEFVSSKVMRISREPKLSATAMRELADVLGYLSKEDISELYQAINAELQKYDTHASRKPYELQADILLVSCLTSGSPSAIRFLLDNRHFFKKHPHMLAVMLFENAELAIRDPSLLPEILEIAKSYSWGIFDVYPKTLAITSTASLIHKLCLSPEARTCSGEGCHSEGRCNENEILDLFLRYAEEGIQNLTTAGKVVFLQALSNLKTPKALELLMPIILGTKEEDMRLRRLAIMSLSSEFMPPTTKPLAQKVLRSLIENPEEHPGVRSIAFLVMTSWNPERAWWAQMALSTWRETSIHMAELITTVMKAIANSKHDMAAVVSKVVPLARPAKFSVGRFFAMFFEENVFPNDYLEPSTFLWFAIEKDIVPSYIFLKSMLPSLHGFPSSIKVNLAHNYFFFIMDFFYPLGPRVYDHMVDEDNYPTVEEMINQKIRELGFKMKGFYEDARVALTIDDDFVFNFARLMPTFFHDVTTGDAVMSSIPGFYEFPYHYKTVDSTVVFPTDLGIPLIVKHLDEAGFRKEHDAISNPPGFEDLVNTLGLDIRLGISQRTSVDMSTLVPWSRRFGVGTGITNQFDIDLHLKFNFGRARTTQFVLDLELFPEKRDVFHSVNKPYTVHHGSFPIHLAKYKDLRVINRFVTYPRGIPGEVKSVGIKWEATWDAVAGKQPSFPEMFSGSNDFDIVFPMHRSWDYRLAMDGSASRGTQFRILLTSTSVDDPESPEEDQREASDVDDEAHARDTLGLREDFQMASHLYEKLNVRPGKHRVFQLSLKERTTETFRGAVLFGSERTRTEHRHLYHFGTAIEVPFSFHLPPLLCINAQVEAPSFPVFTSHDEIMKSSLDITVQAQGHAGDTCENGPIIEAKGIFRLAEEAAQHNIQTDRECGIFHSEEPVLDAEQHFQYRAFQLNVSTLKVTGPMLYQSLFDLMSELDEVTYGSVSLRQTEAESHYVATVDLQRHDLNHDILMDYVNPSLFSRSPFYSASCRIEESKIRTYDGLEFQYAPDSCWRVATMDHLLGRTMVLLRHVGHWEVQILYKTLGLLFDVSRSQVLVNGKAPDDDSELYEVSHLEGAILLKILHSTTIKVSDKVEIYIQPDHRTAMAGLCGNFNNERYAEMSGPQGCVFTDPRLFIASWSLPTDGCDAETLRAEMQKVEEYRENCPKLTYHATGDIVNSHCTVWHYPARPVGQFECTAVTPVPKCGSGCQSSNSEEKQIVYRCEKATGAGPPSFLRDFHSCGDSVVSCYELVFLTSYPSDCAPIEE